MDTIKTLRNAGFTESEAKTYLTLLKIGKSTSYSIVEHAGVSSGRIYETLHKLSKKGLVSHISIKGKMYFEAAGPDRLSDYMRDRELRARKDREATLNTENCTFASGIRMEHGPMQ